MTTQEMQKRSQEKVKQIHELMKLLQVNAECREQVTQQGFIERVVYWVDYEKYPQDPDPVETTEPKEPEHTETEEKTPDA